jgi:HSP90 family molecular chaperone
VLLLKGTDGTTDKLVDLLPQKPEKAEDADKPETPAAAPKKIYYTDSESGMGVYASAYAARGTKVYLLDQAIDTHFVLFLEQHEQGLRFARIDSDFDALQKKEDAQADAAPDTADLIKAFESVAGEGVKVEARELDSELPCLLISAENATRMHTMSKIMGLPESGYRDLQLVVNTASPVVKKLAAAPDRELTAHCYDLARLSAGVLDVKDITAFVQRAAKLL